MDEKKVRRLIYGVGINDSNTPVRPTIHGKAVTSHPYSVWVNILKRCYDPEYHAKKPSYKDCVIADEWRYFSAFREWMNKQDWEGKCIDKDILQSGNKIYSPETCVFVSRSLNNLLTNHCAGRGKYPQGVTLHKQSKKYVAEISIDGKSHHIGSYATPEEASEAYRLVKGTHIRSVALDQDDLRLRFALMRHAKEYDPLPQWIGGK